jgi:branched-chain amino acid transport system substrate-binding protein
VNDDYGRGLRANLLEVLDTARFPLVLDLPHTEDDLRPEVLERAAMAVRSVTPDIVLFFGSSTSLGPRLAGLRLAIGDTPILGSDAVSSWSRFGVDSVPWAGVRFVDFVDLSATAALQRFAEQYTARTGLAATGPDALTYDAVRLVLDAVREGATTGESVRAYLASLGRERPPYEGLTGTLQFTAQGDPERPHVLITIPPSVQLL